MIFFQPLGWFQPSALTVIVVNLIQIYRKSVYFQPVQPQASFCNHIAEFFFRILKLTWIFQMSFCKHVYIPELCLRILKMTWIFIIIADISQKLTSGFPDSEPSSLGIPGQPIVPTLLFHNQMGRQYQRSGRPYGSSGKTLGPDRKQNKYGCQFCEKRFSRPALLKRHVLIHTGEKPYKCTMCDHASNRKGNLEIHMMSHLGTKPYMCEVCQMTFASKLSLDMHMITHTQDGS